MPQFNRSELDRTAREHGFIRDTFEKVIRLKEILAWVNSVEGLRDHLLLKGGTAINLMLFHLPRLSVDIDFDFTPNISREEMQATRERITGMLNAYMRTEGYTPSEETRMHHSLDAFHFFYTNAAGNRDMIKVEINYSLRAHILESCESTMTSAVFGDKMVFRTVHAMEIFASKVNALLTRAAARDLYDVNSMIDHGLFEEQRDLFRKCIVFYASITQKTTPPLFDTTIMEAITSQKIRRDLFPVLIQKERGWKAFEREERIASAGNYLSALLRLTPEEREYLRLFASKEYRPELLFDDGEIVERLRQHPMALWKCREG